MDVVTLKKVILDEDAALFSLEDDLLLKAKAIQHSILPKLNVILEESLSRVRKTYGIEVFKENSIIHSAPNFREKRKNTLKINYTYAFFGLGACHLPIWSGIKRLDNKPAKIIPYVLGYRFSDNGLSLVFNPVRYKAKYTKETNELFLNFVLENCEYIQTIQALSGMLPIINLNNKNLTIKPYRDIIRDYLNEGFYDLRFVRTIKSPLSYCDINSLIQSFAIFFPIYYSILEIARGMKNPFENILSMINCCKIVNEYPSKEKENPLSTKRITDISMIENKFIKVGVRWQVFERDNFKCVSCGKSANDGAILHVDHIIPRSKGGNDTIDNYQTLCHSCNIGKSNKSEINLRKGTTSP